MASVGANRGIDFDTKLQTLEKEICQTFKELFQALEKRRQDLLSRLSVIKSAYDHNVQLNEAIEQLRVARDKAVNIMTSNLLGEDLGPIKQSFEDKILSKESKKTPVLNLDLIEFRCLSENILRALEETNLIELLPEYAGRENPIVKKCSIGHENAEFRSPLGLAIDGNSNEVYVVDRNNRIQVMDVHGKFLRLFTHDYLQAPYDICLSDTEVFVTDEENYLLKFAKSGKFLRRAGSRGIKPGCFSAIRGLCYEDGLVYVCDMRLQMIQIFTSDLIFLKTFGYGEVRSPNSIRIHSNSIYVLTRNQNKIYCYDKACHLQNTIQLTGQKSQMTDAVFFTMDSNGNFLISDQTSTKLSEIRIFSPNGTLKHILGKGHLSFLGGLALDDNGSIICINYTQRSCFQKY